MMKNKNDFPIQVFPKVLQDFIMAYIAATNLSTKFTAVAILLALATAVGTTYSLLYKTTYKVFASFYCAFVAQSGAGKTAPLSMAFSPIKKCVERAHADYKAAKQKHDTYMALPAAERSQVPKVEPPVLHRYLMDDFTFEKLLRSLSETRRGLGIKVEELNGLFKSIGRYTGGASPEIEFYNSFWSGENKSVDRVTGEPLYIPSSALTICGNIQPGVMQTMFDKGNDQNGLIARFLFCTEPNAQIPRQDRTELDTSMLDAYNELMGKILDTPMMVDLDGKEVPREMGLTEEAIQLYQTWHNEMFIPDADEESRPLYREAKIKLSQYVLRFTLLLEVVSRVVDDDPDANVGLEAMKSAILLYNFFVVELDYIYGIIYEKDITLLMTEKQRKFYNGLRPDGVIIGESLYELARDKYGLSKDMVKKFLGNKKYFTRTEKGTYRRNYAPDKYLQL